MQSALLSPFAGFFIYFSYGIWHSSEARYHDNISLHTLSPHNTRPGDELFDDSDTEVHVHYDERENGWIYW